MIIYYLYSILDYDYEMTPKRDFMHHDNHYINKQISKCQNFKKQRWLQTFYDQVLIINT